MSLCFYFVFTAKPKGLHHVLSHVVGNHIHHFQCVIMSCNLVLQLTACLCAVPPWCWRMASLWNQYEAHAFQMMLRWGDNSLMSLYSIHPWRSSDRLEQNVTCDHTQHIHHQHNTCAQQPPYMQKVHTFHQHSHLSMQCNASCSFHDCGPTRIQIPLEFKIHWHIMVCKLTIVLGAA